MTSTGPTRPTVEWVISRLESTWRAMRGGRLPDWARDDLAEIPPARLMEGLIALLGSALADCWERGWQPADVHRVIRDDLDKTAADLVGRAIRDQASTYSQWGRVVAPRWMAQVDAIQIGHSHPRIDQVRLVSGLRAVQWLRILPTLPLLVAPPSRWPESSLDSQNPPPLEPSAAPAQLDPGMLERIRALLAKAEATEYEAEADAFTAKAQELMTRYRVDRAILEGRSRATTRAIGRRLGVEKPYPEARYLLLAGIAAANACRAVWSKSLGFATVFGHPEDIDGVEELYTSLLVQVNVGLRREGRRGDRRSAGSTRRFRRSYLLGFADRIGHRLQEASAATVTSMEAESGVALVPLLDARRRAADEAMSRIVGDVRRLSLSVSDGLGYARGVAAADAADLSGPAGVLSG